MEELIGEEHQQRGDRFKQDAVSDVTAENTQQDAAGEFMYHSEEYAPPTSKRTQLLLEFIHGGLWRSLHERLALTVTCFLTHKYVHTVCGLHPNVFLSFLHT